MNLVDEFYKLSGMIDKLAPRLAKSTLYQKQLRLVLREARRLQLATLYQDTEDAGADHGSWEEEECHEGNQEIQSGQGMNRTRIERLERQRADTSRSSTERTRTASVTVLKP